MKIKYLLPLAVIFFTLASFKADQKSKSPEKKADPLKWYDWNEGYPKALKSNKIIVMDVYTDWCGWCKKMDKDTYDNEEIISTLNKKFIAIKLNPEKEDIKYKVDSLTLNGYQLFNMLTNGQRTGYPTTIFIYPKEKQVVLQPGYQDANRFKATLANVLENGNKIKGQPKEKSSRK